MGPRSESDDHQNRAASESSRPVLRRGEVIQKRIEAAKDFELALQRLTESARVLLQANKEYAQYMNQARTQGQLGAQMRPPLEFAETVLGAMGSERDIDVQAWERHRSRIEKELWQEAAAEVERYVPVVAVRAFLDSASALATQATIKRDRKYIEKFILGGLTPSHEAPESAASKRSKYASSTRRRIRESLWGYLKQLSGPRATIDGHALRPAEKDDDLCRRSARLRAYAEENEKALGDGDGLLLSAIIEWHSIFLASRGMGDAE